MTKPAIEFIYLDTNTLEEKTDGMPYTRKSLGNVTILISGHTEQEEQANQEGGEEQ